MIIALALAVALPIAQYDAVIPALQAWPFSTSEATVYSLAAADPPADALGDALGAALLFDSPGGTAVAMLPARDFLGENTVVVGVDRVGDWVRVLTPARQALPSAGSSPAQTSAWMPISELSRPIVLDTSITVSVSAKTLTIHRGSMSRSFPVGVGTSESPTPTGVTGYLQERYFDASQQQTNHPVQLTSLHSAAADEPFGGRDGGLIGLHYEKDANGAVSHGCVRLGAAAVAAVNALPLGTLVTLTP